MISVRDANKSFQKQRVLKDITIDFEDGMISGIVGRNGSGKTVLLKCIIGLMKLDCGEITVDGMRVGKDVDFPENLGFIVDRPGFLNDASAMRNLKYLASIRGRIGNENIRQAIQQVELNPDERKHVGKYSMGMKQRLGIAQAIMEDPQILLLDEPMNGLDNKGVEEMRALLKKLRDRGKTILLTSHNPLDIEALCDTVCAMDAGVLTKVR